MICVVNTAMALGIMIGTITSTPPEQEGDPALLVSRLSERDDASTAAASFLSLSRTLRKGSPAAVKAVQDSLCQQLATSEDPAMMGRICLALRSAPRDDAVAMVVDRLQPNKPREVRTAACRALRHLVSRRLPSDPKITELALARLSDIIRDRLAPLVLTDAAVAAVAAFGPPGFDTLMKLHNDPNTPKQHNNMLYTALSETGDLRALPILRAAVSTPETRDGQRIEAANAVGALFALAGRRGSPVATDERTKCWQALYPYLADQTPDQLFGVALKSLAEIAPIHQDAGVLQALNTALVSSRRVRREAALDVLYRTGLPLDGVQSTLVRWSAASDSDDSLRATASAVLDQGDLQAETDPTSSQTDAAPPQ
jgi:hypothetical protein